MDRRSVRWKEDDENNANGPDPPNKLKKSRSVFGKLRQSWLSKRDRTGTADNALNLPENKKDSVMAKTKLRRSMSVDGGLQQRIDELSRGLKRGSSGDDSGFASPYPSPILNTACADSVQRTRSLAVNNVRETIIDSEFYDRESQPAPVIDFPLDLDLHKENSQLATFDCAWLAPTKPAHLFQGQMFLLPGTALFFQGQRFKRQIRLRFRYPTILNISRAGWNGQAGNALIIDLVEGKRRQWVFVNWDHWSRVEPVIVNDWRASLLANVRHQRALELMEIDEKCGKLGIGDNDHHVTAPESLKVWRNTAVEWLHQHVAVPLSCLPFINDSTPSSTTITRIVPYRNIELEAVVEPIYFSAPPSLIRDIFLERATTFLQNIRAMLGVIVLHERREASTKLALLVTVGGRPLRLNVEHKLLVDGSDEVLLETRYFIIDKDSESTASYNVYWHITRIVHDGNFDQAAGDETEFIKTRLQVYCSSTLPSITTERSLRRSSSRPLGIHTSLARLTAYFKSIFFPQMLPLLQMLLKDADDESQAVEIAYELSPNPTARWVLDTVRLKARLFEAAVTTCLLPNMFILSKNAAIQRVALYFAIFAGIFVCSWLFLAAPTPKPNKEMLVALDKMAQDLTLAIDQVHDMHFNQYARRNIKNIF